MRKKNQAKSQAMSSDMRNTPYIEVNDVGVETKGNELGRRE
jgi:hypothetical protein